MLQTADTYQSRLVSSANLVSHRGWLGPVKQPVFISNQATRIAEGCVCQGCGKVYANKRHVECSEAYRLNWDRFVPTDMSVTSHSQLPLQPVVRAFDCDAPAPCSQDDMEAPFQALSTMPLCTVEEVPLLVGGIAAACERRSQVATGVVLVTFPLLRP